MLKRFITSILLKLRKRAFNMEDLEEAAKWYCNHEITCFDENDE